MKHLLVTNDFPPKVGGIQSYLWELWRRLPPESFTVLTTPYDGAAEFDADQPFRVFRSREPVLLPQPLLARRIDALADEAGADLVVLDPALPVGLLGPHLARPYGVVLHGAEDPFVPAPDINAFMNELREAKVDWQMVNYGGAVHSFTDRDATGLGLKGAAYDEKADRRSWEVMKDFFNEIFAK